MTRQTTIARFDLGRLVATPGALDLGLDLRLYLARHAAGDLCAGDAR